MLFSQKLTAAKSVPLERAFQKARCSVVVFLLCRDGCAAAGLQVAPVSLGALLPSAAGPGQHGARQDGVCCWVSLPPLAHD